MKRYDFNHDWECRTLGREEEAVQVTLPHDAMRTERRVNTSLGERHIGWYEGNDYEYRKCFVLPAELEGKKLTLEFEGVYHNAEVFINGRKASNCPYGYTNFYVEMNRFLKEGENEIRVIAQNSDQPNSRWYSGTGIYRPVWLWAAGEKHIKLNGIRTETLSIRPAKLRIQVKTSAPGNVVLEIYDGEKVIYRDEGENVFELTLPDAKTWNTDTPYLYTAKVIFEDDEAEEQFGIRTLSWTPQKGLAINGKRTVIRGACIHHDNGLLGACTYPEAEERRIRILKEAGYNAVRSAHNPCSKYLLEACDRLGMLMMDEYVDCWYMHKTQNDYASYVKDRWKRDLKAMVDKDFNHPCVIMYSTGNEVAETAEKRGIALQRHFTKFLHKLDATRPVTCGINIFFNFLSSMGLGVYSDEKAQKQAEAAQKAAQEELAKGTLQDKFKKREFQGKSAKQAVQEEFAKQEVRVETVNKPGKKPVGSEFYNVLAAKLGCDFMKFGASLPPCDWKTKDAFAAMDITGGFVHKKFTVPDTIKFILWCQVL